MKRLIIVLMLVSVITFANKPLSGVQVENNNLQVMPFEMYMETFASFFKNACERYLHGEDKRSKVIKKFEKSMGIHNLCWYVYDYSKIKYSEKVLNCYKNGKSIKECVLENNVLRKALEME